jgi:glycosyltransferase involved in cell wall biosynthesis
MISEISIIIPTLNEEKYIGILLTALTKQHLPKNSEVIIVDGKSSDQTIKEAKKYESFFNRLIVVSTHKGVAHQRNVGAQHAKYETLLFIDADMYLTDNFLPKLFSKIDTTKPFIDTCSHLALNMNSVDIIFLFSVYPICFIFSLFLPVTAGSFILIPLKHHQAIGGFNEKAVMGEDIDYYLRAIRAGAKHHIHWLSPVYFSPRRARQMGRLKLAFTWLGWYIHMLTKGPITSEKEFYYPFGKH